MSTSWSGQRRSFPTASRLAILRRDPTCRCAGCPHCTPNGCNRPSTIADHILNHAACQRAGIDPDTLDNGQGLCGGCHDVKTRAEQVAGRARLKPRRTPRHPSDAA